MLGTSQGRVAPILRGVGLAPVFTLSRIARATIEPNEDATPASPALRAGPIGATDEVATADASWLPGAETGPGYCLRKAAVLVLLAALTWATVISSWSLFHCPLSGLVLPISPHLTMP